MFSYDIVSRCFKKLSLGHEVFIETEDNIRSTDVCEKYLRTIYVV